MHLLSSDPCTHAEPASTLHHRDNTTDHTIDNMAANFAPYQDIPETQRALAARRIPALRSTAHATSPPSHRRLPAHMSSTTILAPVTIPRLQKQSA